MRKKNKLFLKNNDQHPLELRVRCIGKNWLRIYNCMYATGSVRRKPHASKNKSVLGAPNSAADLWVFWRSLLPFLTCIYGTLLDVEM